MHTYNCIIILYYSWHSKSVTDTDTDVYRILFTPGEAIRDGVILNNPDGLQERPSHRCTDKTEGILAKRALDK